VLIPCRQRCRISFIEKIFFLETISNYWPFELIKKIFLENLKKNY